MQEQYRQWITDEEIDNNQLPNIQKNSQFNGRIRQSMPQSLKSSFIEPQNAKLHQSSNHRDYQNNYGNKIHLHRRYKNSQQSQYQMNPHSQIYRRNQYSNIENIGEQDNNDLLQYLATEDSDQDPNLSQIRSLRPLNENVFRNKQSKNRLNTQQDLNVDSFAQFLQSYEQYKKPQVSQEQLFQQQLIHQQMLAQQRREQKRREQQEFMYKQKLILQNQQLIDQVQALRKEIKDKKIEQKMNKLQSEFELQQQIHDLKEEISKQKQEKKPQYLPPPVHLPAINQLYPQQLLFQPQSDPSQYPNPMGMPNLMPFSMPPYPNYYY